MMSGPPLPIKQVPALKHWSRSYILVWTRVCSLGILYEVCPPLNSGCKCCNRYCERLKLSQQLCVFRIQNCEAHFFILQENSWFVETCMYTWHISQHSLKTWIRKLSQGDFRNGFLGFLDVLHTTPCFQLVAIWESTHNPSLSLELDTFLF